MRDGVEPEGGDVRARGVRVVNAGIIGHAGFLLAQRLGAAKTAAIVYRAAAAYLHRYAGFADFADATAAAAQDLYGQTAAETTAVQAVWRDVGVAGLTP